MAEEDKDISIFEGWENSEEIDFFGETPEPTKHSQKDDGLDNTEEKEQSEEKEKKEEEKEEEITFDLFELDDDEDTEKKEKDKEDTEKSTETEFEQNQEISTKSTLNFLKEKGIINYELEEGEELTDEKAEELLEDSYAESVDERVKELTEDFPDILKQMVNYHKNGGDVTELISSIKTKSTINKDTDLTQEANQELVIREQLAAEGHDEEYISTNIDFLKDSGKLESTSKKLFDKIVKRQEDTLKAQTEAQKEARIAAKQKQRAFKNEIASHLKDNETIGKIKFSPKDKKDLPSYISDTSVKLEGGQTISALQRDLYKALQDKDKTLLLAKVLRSDFDFSDISKAVTTEVTKEVKKELQHSQSLTPKKSKGSSSFKKKKDLADFF